MRRRLVVFPAVLSALLLFPGLAAALGTLDQQQPNSNIGVGANVAGTLTPAQLFTAGITGQLDHVDLLLSSPTGGPVDDLTVEIWTVAAGIPASPVPGASATVLETDVPATPTWVQVAISAPSVAGTQYAIVLSAPTITGPCPCWVWALADPGGYAAGGLLLGTNFTNWGGVGQSDFAFRTYVTPPAPTPAASLVNAATAPPATGSPLAALGFAALLLGALGVLVVVNARGVARRR